MKSKLAIVCFLIQLHASKAQFYGQKIYSATLPGVLQTVCTSAATTGINSSGFLTGMYVPNGGNSATFCVRKTDASGNYTSSNDFESMYKIYYHSNCSVLYNLVDNCIGVSVIESSSSSPGTEWYALAAVCNMQSGTHFLAYCTLDQFGGPAYKGYYPFPSNTIGATKPKIIESSSTPGVFYICGGYITTPSNVGYMYVLKVDNTGNLLWSNIYKSGTHIEASDILESPYSSSEIVVVGRVVPDVNQAPYFNKADDGFFLKLSSSTGAILTYKVYGSDMLFVEHQRFSTIAPAYSLGGGADGYVIGGYSDSLTGVQGPLAEGSWIIKLDQSGNIVWNTIVSSGLSPAPMSGIATGVFERYSPISNQYTYFSATAMGTEIKVMKLNNLGVLVAATNEFNYTGIAPSNPFTYPAQLTQDANGFQVYGTDGVTPTDNYLVSAYFNGHSDCFENFASGLQAPGPSSIIAPLISISGNLTLGTCQSFDMSMGPVFPSINTPCSAPSLPLGNNAKEIISSIHTNTELSLDYEIYPNPTEGNITITSKAQIEELEIVVYDMAGKNVYTQIVKTENQNYTDNLPLENGIYLIKVRNNDNKQTVFKKIVIQK